MSNLATHPRAQDGRWKLTADPTPLGRQLEDVILRESPVLVGGREIIELSDNYHGFTEAEWNRRLAGEIVVPRVSVPKTTPRVRYLQLLWACSGGCRKSYPWTQHPHWVVDSETGAPVARALYCDDDIEAALALANAS